MITIVTAFFDIGRANWIGPAFLKRSVDDYFGHFNRLAKIDNPMVVHTTSDQAERVLAIREQYGHREKTTIVVWDNLWTEWASVLAAIQKNMEDPDFRSFIQNPQMPEYWNAKYVLLNCLKAFFVAESVKRRLVQTDQTAWIDFGYCRDDNRFPEGFSWTHDFGDKINLFALRDLEPERPLYEIVQTGDVYVMGCHIVAPTGKWDFLWSLMRLTLAEVLSCGLIDDDQTMLMLCALREPAHFKINKIDVSKDGWFVVFKTRPSEFETYKLEIKMPRVADYKRAGRWPYHWMAGQGLVPVVKAHAPAIRALEVGVQRGENACWFLESCKNIVEFIGVDPFPLYWDVDHQVTQQFQDEARADMEANLAPFADKYTHIYLSSEAAAPTFADEYFDYIFIDGDHSYEAVKRDLALYFSKAKTGAIFAGHDWHMDDVKRAVTEFREEKGITTPLQHCDLNCWYWIKE